MFGYLAGYKDNVVSPSVIPASELRDTCGPRGFTEGRWYSLSLVVSENVHRVRMDGFPGASVTLMVLAGQAVPPCTISLELSCNRLTDCVQRPSEAWARPEGIMPTE